MVKKRFVLDTIGGIGVDDEGEYLLVFFTNYGKLTYDTKFDKFKLNDVEISSHDYEFGNVYREIFRYIDLFVSYASKLD